MTIGVYQHHLTLLNSFVITTIWKYKQTDDICYFDEHTKKSTRNDAYGAGAFICQYKDTQNYKDVSLIAGNAT